MYEEGISALFKAVLEKYQNVLKNKVFSPNRTVKKHPSK